MRWVYSLPDPSRQVVTIPAQPQDNPYLSASSKLVRHDSSRTQKQSPKAEPDAEPEAEPIAEPTAEPIAEPTAEPTAEPRAEPKLSPTFDDLTT